MFNKNNTHRKMYTKGWEYATKRRKHRKVRKANKNACARAVREWDYV